MDITISPVLFLAATRLAAVADEFAGRPGLGEAFVGVVLLVACTSLSGMKASAVAAFQGLAEMAVSNAFGRIAARTAFLIVVDFFYRRANLEHAAASLENVIYGVMLIGLLAIPLLASASPDVTMGPLHPARLLLFAGYLAGLHLARQTRDTPMWRPEENVETRIDDPEPEKSSRSLSRLSISFALLASLTLVGGFYHCKKRRGPGRVHRIVTEQRRRALCRPIPELVTTIAAVRRARKQLHLYLGEICYRYNHRAEDLHPLIITMSRQTPLEHINQILSRKR